MNENNPDLQPASKIANSKTEQCYKYNFKN